MFMVVLRGVIVDTCPYFSLLGFLIMMMLYRSPRPVSKNEGLYIRGLAVEASGTIQSSGFTVFNSVLEARMQDLRREVLDGNLNPQALQPVQGKSSFQGVSQRSG